MGLFIYLPYLITLEGNVSQAMISLLSPKSDWTSIKKEKRKEKNNSNIHICAYTVTVNIIIRSFKLDKWYKWFSLTLLSLSLIQNNATGSWNTE